MNAGLRAQVRWHRSLDDVTGEAPALYIAHEFFDALPVHHFQRTSRGWRERLVDMSQDLGDPRHLRLVLAPNETPASKLLLPPRLAALSPPESTSSAISSRSALLVLCQRSRIPLHHQNHVCNHSNEAEGHFAPLETGGIRLRSSADRRGFLGHAGGLPTGP